AGKFVFGLVRAAALCQRVPEGVDICLGERCRPETQKVHAVLAHPRRAGGVGGAVPERGMRLLQRPQRNRHVFELVILAGVAERVRGQARADAAERIDEDRARFLVIDLVILELERRYAAADPHFHASVTEMVENANLLDQGAAASTAGGDKPADRAACAWSRAPPRRDRRRAPAPY